MKFPQRIELFPSAAIAAAIQPRLPSYEEATGMILGTPRLPSYSEGFRMRYHPYRRSMNTRDAIDKLMHTTYDDEYIKLPEIPPALPPRPVPPLVPGPLVVRRRDGAVQMQHRARLARLDMIILHEFVAAPPGCARRQQTNN